MGWCPKCRNEYVEGIAVCPDCNIDLTDELPAEENEMEKECGNALPGAESGADGLRYRRCGEQ